MQSSKLVSPGARGPLLVLALALAAGAVLVLGVHRCVGAGPRSVVAGRAATTAPASDRGTP